MYQKLSRPRKYNNTTQLIQALFLGSTKVKTIKLNIEHISYRTRL